MKLLIVNVNLSHLWSDLKSNARETNTVIPAWKNTLCHHKFLLMEKMIKTPHLSIVSTTFSLIFAFMVFWSSCDHQQKQNCMSYMIISYTKVNITNLLSQWKLRKGRMQCSWLICKISLLTKETEQQFWYWGDILW